MADYRYNAFGGVVRISDEATIPEDPRNRDYQALLLYLEAGNSIDPFVPLQPRRMIDKARIVDRLIEAGKLGAARAALDAQTLEVREKWNARTSIYADDPTALALLKAIGAD